MAKTTHVANTFLQRAFREKQSITPMKLQKLVYFLHGWHLAVTGKPAIQESIEAWPYGPVIPSLYYSFKSFGGNPITSYATEIDPITGNEKSYVVGDSDKQFYEVFDAVWEKYIGFDALQLSAMTHAARTPWSIIRENGTSLIPDTLIKDYFVNEVRSKHSPIAA